MNTAKYLLIPTITASVLVLAGCTTQTSTNTNTTSDNANVEVVANTNETVDNDNTNVDTSNWLTYTNDEYGFSFRYPSNLEVNDDLTEAGYAFILDVVTKEKDPVMGRGNSIILFGVLEDIRSVETEIISNVGVKEQNLQIDNQSAVQYTFYQGMEEDATKPHNTKRIIVENNGREILIVQTHFNVNDGYDNWFDSIESSIKFF